MERIKIKEAECAQCKRGRGSVHANMCCFEYSPCAEPSHVYAIFCDCPVGLEVGDV